MTGRQLHFMFAALKDVKGGKLLCHVHLMGGHTINEVRCIQTLENGLVKLSDNLRAMTFCCEDDIVAITRVD